MEDKLFKTAIVKIARQEDLGDFPLGILLSHVYELEPWTLMQLRPEECN